MYAKTLARQVREYLDLEQNVERGCADGDAERVAQARRDLRAAADAPHDGRAEPLARAVRTYLDAEPRVEQRRAAGREPGLAGSKLDRARHELEAQLLAVMGDAPAAAAADPASPAGPAKPRRILIAVDASLPAEWALETGGQLARDLSARVTLVHVVVPALAMADDFVTAQTLEALHREDGVATLDEAQQSLPPEVEADRVMRAGDPASEIVAVARDTGADLIVIGTHGRRGIARLLLGSTAEAIIRRAPCPVITVGHEPGRRDAHATADGGVRRAEAAVPAAAVAAG